MPNVVTTNPIVLVSALPSYRNAPGAGMQNTPFFVERVEWLSPVNIGDTFQLTDANSNVVAVGVCEVALQSQIFPLRPRRLVKDIQLVQISSGTLYVWLGN